MSNDHVFATNLLITCGIGEIYVLQYDMRSFSHNARASSKARILVQRV